MTERSTRLFDQSTRVILEHRIVRSERSNDRRTGLYFMFMICILYIYIYIYIYIMSEKSILTRKSQKNKLICVCVCVFFVFLFLFFMSEESVLTNKIKERKKTS